MAVKERKKRKQPARTPAREVPDADKENLPGASGNVSGGGAKARQVQGK